MAIKALTLEATTRYVSKFDPDQENPTIWVLGTLDSRVMAMLRDRSTRMMVDPSRPDDEVETTINTDAVNFDTVAYGLLDVENFGCDEGDVPFKTRQVNHYGAKYRMVETDFLRRVPMKIIRELAKKLLKDNMLSEEEAGN